jgi:hypothetical protein
MSKLHRRGDRPLGNANGFATVLILPPCSQPEQDRTHYAAFKQGLGRALGKKITLSHRKRPVHQDRLRTNDHFTKTGSQKKNPFLLAENLGLASAGLSVTLSDDGTVDSASFVLGGVGTRTRFGGSHVYMKPINFTKTGLGQT